MVEERTIKIQHQSREIIESIRYASRIQSAILPKEEDLGKILPNYFVLYRPKDIVSGDFYWIKQIGFKVIVASVDCTGHGVPGAFMSILGVSILNEIMQQNPVPSPGVILSEMRKKVKKSLGQTGKHDEPADGMDIALCIIDMIDSSVQFAGAFNPLYLIRANNENEDKKIELLEYKGDRMPVGIYLREKPAFTTHNIKVNKGDCIYLFSDGYVDQNGGPDAEKFKHHRFRNLLLAVSGKPMIEQKQILQDTINDWMDKKYEQVDDILIIGFGF